MIFTPEGKMVMEQRRSLFGRLFARLWRNHDNYASNDSRTVGQALARMGRSNSTPVLEPPGPFAQQVRRNTVLTQFLILPTNAANSVHSDENADSVNAIERPVVNTTQGLRFGVQTNSYVPKCLTEVDCQALLTGQTTYDDFSENCWLENHLHRFGEVQVDPVQVVDSPDSYPDSDTSIPPYPSSLPHWHSILDDFQLTVADLPPPPPPPHLDEDNLSNDSSPPPPEVYCGNTSSTISSNSRSTVSDVTQFYNSMGLLGSSFSEEEVAMDPPPPYSELPEDPPPPYTYASRVSERAPTSSLSRRASTQVLSMAILW